MLRQAALANHEYCALPLAELWREPCTVLWGEVGRAGGGSISSALSHSTSVVSRTSAWSERHGIHGYSILQMTLLHGEEGGGKRTSVGETRINLQMKRGWEKKRRTGGVRAANEGNCVNTAACLRTTAAVLNLGLSSQPLSRAVSERGNGAEEEKKWFEALIPSFWTSRDGNPKSVYVNWSNFTQEKCLRITSLS